jgi:hypothetical protein
MSGPAMVLAASVCRSRTVTVKIRRSRRKSHGFCGISRIASKNKQCGCMPSERRLLTRYAEGPKLVPVPKNINTKDTKSQRTRNRSLHSVHWGMASASSAEFDFSRVFIKRLKGMMNPARMTISHAIASHGAMARLATIGWSILRTINPQSNQPRMNSKVRRSLRF